MWNEVICQERERVKKYCEKEKKKRSFFCIAMMLKEGRTCKVLKQKTNKVLKENWEKI